MLSEKCLKGRFVSEKQLNKVRATSKVGKSNAGRKVTRESAKKNASAATLSDEVSGYRVVSLSHLGQSMKCSCGVYLSFENTTKEVKFGLASELTIRCNNCLLLNKVTTAKECKNTNGYNVYEPNVRAALGALHTGLGHTQMTNLFSTMDIPTMSQPTFKRHERNLIPAIEKVTVDGLEEATKKERKLTLQNVEEKQKYL
ncbi:hypothetical protein PV326_000300 [Microctonus aethiopoides]|nr:hypothetical protein PV326_000300 [Microctonus aethiopoides]